MTSILSRRAVAVALTAAGAATVLAGCGGVGARLTFNDTEKVKVTEIVMTGRSGDVAVRTAAIAETRISRVIHRNSDPGQTYRLAGTVLHIDTDCGRNCSVSYDIEAPAGVTVRGEVTSGDIALDGVGATDVKLTSGDVMVRGATGAVRIRGTSGDINVLDGTAGVTIETTSGDVRAMNVAGPVTAAVTSGDVEVKTTAPASVTAHTTSGDVDVIVPAGSYQIATRTSSGDDRIIGIVNDPRSKNVIDVRTRSGDATVSGAPTA
jgi:Putative adhesin